MGNLAITGGVPVRTEPFPAWPQYGEQEKRNLDEVLASLQWGTLGPRVAQFEEAFAAYLGVAHAQTVSNGTVTVRDRDTLVQDRLSADEVPAFVARHLVSE